MKIYQNIYNNQNTFVKNVLFENTEFKYFYYSFSDLQRVLFSLKDKKYYINENLFYFNKIETPFGVFSNILLNRTEFEMIEKIALEKYNNLIGKIRGTDVPLFLVEIDEDSLKRIKNLVLLL